MKALELVKEFHREESGQDLVEYALVVVAAGGAVASVSSGIASTFAAAITSLGTKISSWLS